MEENNIIKKVKETSRWVSPLVIVPKSNGDIWLVINMHRPNLPIKRQRHPIPTVEEVIQGMQGVAIFSKLDLCSSYHQIQLDESTTFSTAFGLRWHKRLTMSVTPNIKHCYNHILHHPDQWLKLKDGYYTSNNFTLQQLQKRQPESSWCVTLLTASKNHWKNQKYDWRIC